jgi:endonuclease YncB( thermonuclease family)
MMARMSAQLGMLFALLLPNTTAWAGANRIAADAYLIDGDNVVVDGWCVRLKGVDALELWATGGTLARDVMCEIVGVQGTLVCALTGERTRGREVGYCTRPDGVDLTSTAKSSSAELR